MLVPNWLLAKIGRKQHLGEIPGILKEAGLHTICQAARCPNIGECFSRQTAAFLILGNYCTRNCRFCGVKKSHAPLSLNPDEGKQIAKLVLKLNLKHVVITSVTRDDLPDGGAGHFVQTIREIRKQTPLSSIEVLIPDFSGNIEALKTVVKERPEVINHNVETPARLYREVCPEADYQRSLSIIKTIKELDKKIVTKSGLMLGLGEEESEILETLADLKKANCDILTLGQYFQPTTRHLAVKRYFKDREFDFLKGQAENLGFLFVSAGSFVRSSYRAQEAYREVVLKNNKLF